MRAAGPARSYTANGGNPLVNLVAEVSKQKDRGSVFIQRPRFFTAPATAQRLIHGVNRQQPDPTA